MSLRPGGPRRLITRECDPLPADLGRKGSLIGTERNGGSWLGLRGISVIREITRVAAEFCSRAGPFNMTMLQLVPSTRRHGSARHTHFQDGVFCVDQLCRRVPDKKGHKSKICNLTPEARTQTLRTPHTHSTHTARTPRDHNTRANTVPKRTNVAHFMRWSRQGKLPSCLSADAEFFAFHQNPQQVPSFCGAPLDISPLSFFF